MRAPKSDPQRHRVYDWETELFGWAGAKASKAVLLKAITSACKLYRVPVPKVVFLTKDKRNGTKLASIYEPNYRRIEIRPRHKELCSVLHETAHAIVDWILGHVSQIHGKEWLGVHMVLMARHKILPLSLLQHHARQRQLAFHTPAITGPDVIRRHFTSRVRKARQERMERLEPTKRRARKKSKAKRS